MPEINTPTTASWGVTSEIGGSASVTGVVTSIEKGAEAILAPEYDEKGRVIKQTHYDTKTTASCTVEVDANVSPPDVGEQITIASFTGYITSARVTEDNQSYRKIAITAEGYAGCNSVTDETEDSST